MMAGQKLQQEESAGAPAKTQLLLTAKQSMAVVRVVLPAALVVCSPIQAIM